MRIATVAVIVYSLGMPFAEARAGDYAYQKGSQYQKSGKYADCESCCRGHCRRREFPSQAFGSTRVAPSGPVVESYPVARAVPTMISMPMLLGATTAARASREVDTCDERIDELDARVEALHLRMMTIQRSVELQTKLLEELRDSGTIGGRRPPDEASE